MTEPMYCLSVTLSMRRNSLRRQLARALLETERRFAIV